MRLLCDLPMAFHIATFPGAGSPRYEFEFGLDGLRGWPLRGFPYLVF